MTSNSDNYHFLKEKHSSSKIDTFKKQIFELCLLTIILFLQDSITEMKLCKLSTSCKS